MLMKLSIILLAISINNNLILPIILKSICAWFNLHDRIHTANNILLIK